MVPDGKCGAHVVPRPQVEAACPLAGKLDRYVLLSECRCAATTSRPARQKSSIVDCKAVYGSAGPPGGINEEAKRCPAP
jgi:hypothetical protein